MLALEERVRPLLLLGPRIQLEGKTDELVAQFERVYLEVKAEKQVYLAAAEAAAFFHYLAPDARDNAVEAWSRGSCRVLVFDDLENRAFKKLHTIIDALVAAGYGEDCLYCSRTDWEAIRDVEFFFPFLSKMPVERTLALLKPGGIAKGAMRNMTLEQMVEAEVAAAGLLVVGKRHHRLTNAEAEILCEDLKGSADHQAAVAALQQEPGSIALLLEGPGAIWKWQLLCGPRNAGYAKDIAPTTLRALWGTDGTDNALHCSTSWEAADAELTALFPDGTLQIQQTLLMVKPHANPRLVELRDDLKAAGFTLVKEKRILLSEARAKEFYAEHQGQHYFPALVREATSGTCTVMVLCRLEAVMVLSQMLGPHLAKDAKLLRPLSLRAKYGEDGQRNGVKSSKTVARANWDIRFFFPELELDSTDEDEVCDFLARKPACAGDPLKSLDGPQDQLLDPTLQQLISQGLLAMCSEQPKGSKAVTWFKDWLLENNPSNVKKERAKFNYKPSEREKTRYVEYGINADGVPYTVAAPPEENTKKIIDVNVSEELQTMRISPFEEPPYVVVAVGANTEATQVAMEKLSVKANLVVLDVKKLIEEEMEGCSKWGAEALKALKKSNFIPDDTVLEILKLGMNKHSDVNRFLLTSFPDTLEQALRFEQALATIAFVLHLRSAAAAAAAAEQLPAEPTSPTAATATATAESPPPLPAPTSTTTTAPDVTSTTDAGGAAVATTTDVADVPSAEDAAKVKETQNILSYYTPIGKVRTVSADADASTLLSSLLDLFRCRFWYLMGAPPVPLGKVGARLEKKYGYSCIDVRALMESLADSMDPDAEAVRASLRKGQPIDASIICPRVLDAVAKGQRQGRTNFVFCDFPQSQKQVEFLEYRIPCTPRPLLLDFSRADAEDLLSLRDVGVVVETQTDAFYEDDRQNMMKGLPGLLRIPLCLADIERKEKGRGPNTIPGFEQQVVEGILSELLPKLKPSISLVLGLPKSNSDVLAKLLASRARSCLGIDCNQLLDKEMERETEVGVRVRTMLSHGQVPGLAYTAELLKDLMTLTSSDSLVLENCPLYVDQVELLEQEFNISKVYFVDADEKGVNQWKARFVAKVPDEQTEEQMKVFSDRRTYLDAIVKRFARQGLLQRLKVTDNAKEAQFSSLLDAGDLPKFVLVMGLSTVLTPRFASLLATQLNASGGALQLNQDTVDGMMTGLQEHISAHRPALVVLDRAPRSESAMKSFLAGYGEPQLIVNLTLSTEALEEEFRAANEDMEDDQVAAAMQAERTAYEGALQAVEAKYPKVLWTVERESLKAPPEEPDKAAEELLELAKPRLLPNVYLVVAPTVGANISGQVADEVCCTNRLGRQSAKFIHIDTAGLFTTASHSSQLEDELYKAAYATSSTGCIPQALWDDLWREAFTSSIDPTGPFVITNLPTASASASDGTTLRDQLSRLAAVSSIKGILVIKLSPEALENAIPDTSSRAQEQARQAALLELLPEQFDESLLTICDVDFSSTGLAGTAVSRACSQFLKWNED